MLSIACLMLNGRCLTDATRNELMLVATEMAERKLGEMKIDGETFKGIVTTNFEVTGIGTFFGVKFDANVESFFGKTELSFILQRKVNRESLEHGHWIQPNRSLVQNASLN